MKNKFVRLIIGVSVFVSIALIVIFKLETGETYVLDIPNGYNLSSVSFELESGSITVATEEEMDKILNGIYDLKLSTKKVSVQDMPTDVEDLVPIRLYYKNEDTVGNYFIYKRKDNYYLEEPYNGIYDITFEQYNYIISLVEE